MQKQSAMFLVSLNFSRIVILLANDYKKRSRKVRKLNLNWICNIDIGLRPPEIPFQSRQTRGWLGRIEGTNQLDWTRCTVHKMIVLRCKELYLNLYDVTVHKVQNYVKNCGWRDNFFGYLIPDSAVLTNKTNEKNITKTEQEMGRLPLIVPALNLIVYLQRRFSSQVLVAMYYNTFAGKHILSAFYLY